MWTWHRPAQPSAEEQTLVEDCEAFLAGRHLPRRSRHGRSIPPWMWINTLAHGSRADIEALARTPAGVSRESGAAPYLAGEVLAAIDRPGLTLGWLQRSFLVPVELRSATGDGMEERWSTREMTTRVRAALDRADATAGRHGSDTLSDRQTEPGRG